MLIQSLLPDKPHQVRPVSLESPATDKTVNKFVTILYISCSAWASCMATISLAYSAAKPCTHPPPPLFTCIIEFSISSKQFHCHLELCRLSWVKTPELTHHNMIYLQSVADSLHHGKTVIVEKMCRKSLKTHTCECDLDHFAVHNHHHLLQRLIFWDPWIVFSVWHIMTAWYCQLWQSIFFFFFFLNAWF